jgi:hypothetical protein
MVLARPLLIDRLEVWISMMMMKPSQKHRPWIVVALALALLGGVPGCPGDIDRVVPTAETGSDAGAGALLFPDGAIKVDDGGNPTLDGGQSPDSLAPDSVPTDTLSCSTYPETLDKQDNNCNSKVDEGFWANTETLSYATLGNQQPACSSSVAFSDVCTSGAHRHCAAKGYTGGFGPVEYGPSDGAIVCLADALVTSASIASLTSVHSGCTASTVFSLFCNSAIHRTCSAMGYVSGVGPVEHSGATSHFICVKHAKVYQVSFATLAGHHAGCTAAQSFAPACQAAINRYCGAAGHTTGFGPVEQNVDAWVVCLDAS